MTFYQVVRRGLPTPISKYYREDLRTIQVYIPTQQSSLMLVVSQDTQDTIKSLAWECCWKALLNLMTLLTKSRKLILDVVFLFIKTETGPSFEDERILSFDESE